MCVGVYVSAGRVLKNANFPNLQRTQKALEITDAFKIFFARKNPPIRSFLKNSNHYINLIVQDEINGVKSGLL